MERRAPNRDMTDTERRVANVVRFGTIAEADYDNARMRVRSGDVVTGWLPFTTRRAQGDRTWSPPEVGEQVVMVAPSGDLAQAVVVGAVYRHAAEGSAPGDKPTVRRTIYQDGTVEEYDRENHTYTLSVVDAGKIVLKVGGSSLEIDAAGIRLQAPRIDLN